MIVLAALAAAAALWWATSPGRLALHRLAARPDEQKRSPRISRPVVAAVLGHQVLALLAGVGMGRFIGVCVWCAGALLLTSAGVLGARRRERAAMHAADEVARGCAVLASECRLGRVPAEALQIAAADVVLYRQAAGVAALGGDVVRTWRRQSSEPGCAGLASLAAAWQVSGTTGAALTTALAAVALDLRRRHALHRLVQGELAAPRATSHLLAALPFAGLGLGEAVGARPFAFLASTGLGHAVLLVATVLTCAGLVWSEQLARGAARAGGP